MHIEHLSLVLTMCAPGMAAASTPEAGALSPPARGAA